MIVTLRPRLLVTGFGSFPGMPQNPTERLVTTLADAPPAGVDILRLDTLWSVSETLPPLAARYDAVLMFGVAGGETMIRYERVSTPYACDKPDAAGKRPGRLARHRYTMFDVPELVREARAAGFPVRLSHSAGDYVCNAGLGAALAGNPKVLFVHVPMTTPRGPLSDAGLVRHARWLITEVMDILRHDTRKAVAATA
ncbi:peptidase C15 pyroglutamyl peptidase I [Stappia sp. 22II-S9-Z10]|nr:peptidase C15 pyroglutamyl peptidase I [Stappia sp. 22II-S9-Z10]